MITPLANRLRALIAGATKGPWSWYYESDLVVLGTRGSEAFEGHVLTASICPACYARGARCTTPSHENARLIVALANIREELAEWAESREMQRSALGHGESCARADAALLAAIARELPKEKP